jgi:cytochrome P450
MEEGFSNLQIFIECQTYASAGMMTTREFIVVATWQLLENPELKAKYLEGDEQVQFAILDEILSRTAGAQVRARHPAGRRSGG